MPGRKRIPPRGSGYHPEPTDHRIGPPKPPPGSAGVSRAKAPPVVIYIERTDNTVEAVRRAIDADPCGTLGHRWVWLVAGGQECVQCGARR